MVTSQEPRVSFIFCFSLLPEEDHTNEQKFVAILNYAVTLETDRAHLLATDTCSSNPHRSLSQPHPLLLGIFSSSNNATKGSLSIPTCTLPSLPMNLPYAHLYPCHSNHSTLSFSPIALVPWNS